MNNNTLVADETEPDLPADERQIVSVLSGIYLDAGLPLYAAVRAALADYACSFDEPTLCLS